MLRYGVLISFLIITEQILNILHLLNKVANWRLQFSLLHLCVLYEDIVKS